MSKDKKQTIRILQVIILILTIINTLWLCGIVYSWNKFQASNNKVLSTNSENNIYLNKRISCLEGNKADCEK